MAYRGKLWPVVLGVLLLIYGLASLDLVRIDSVIVGIIEIAAGVLVLLNK